MWSIFYRYLDTSQGSGLKSFKQSNFYGVKHYNFIVQTPASSSAIPSFSISNLNHENSTKGSITTAQHWLPGHKLLTTIVIQRWMNSWFIYFNKIILDCMYINDFYVQSLKNCSDRIFFLKAQIIYLLKLWWSHHIRVKVCTLRMNYRYRYKPHLQGLGSL